MTVQVAMQGNDARFANSALVSPQSYLLTAFYARGVPLDWPDALPISLERAVRFAWDQLGARIAEVPELFARGDIDLDGTYVLKDGWARSCNRWRIVLEHDVNVRSGPAQSVRTTREVWVGSRTCARGDYVPLLQVPVANQVTDVTLLYSDLSVSPQRNYAVRTPVAAPIRFEIAERVVVP